MSELLHEFYVVTKYSVYRVTDTRGENDCPIVEKVAGNTEGDMQIADRFNGGRLVSISKQGIRLFDPHPKGGTEIAHINSHYWGGGSSEIVALFSNKEDAQACLLNEDRVCCDPRWSAQRKEVLDTIGNDHPVFKLSQSYNFKFPEQS